MNRTAEIAGAGFAGLTVATELARRGWRVRVHEQSPEPRAFGAGIFLWENGLQVLNELGATDRALSRYHEASLWEECDSAGSQLGTRPFPLPGGLRMITLTRQDLFEALHEQAVAAGVEIRTGSRAIAAGRDGELVTADGRRWTADLVVGADGIRSAVRDSLGLLDEHQVFDFGLYRFLVPLDRAPGRDGRWRNYVNYWNIARKRRVLYVPCNTEDLYLLLGATADDSALRLPLDPAVWTASFPTLEPVLAELPEAPRYDRYEVVRLTRWSAGRVAIVGDAAHAMPPTIGQGAGTAMMNALNLARIVAAGADVELALDTWETENRGLTEHTQRESVTAVHDLFPQAGETRDEWREDTLVVAKNVPKP
ncbi:FAD-dependent oxidoreductase [Amycolatopsis anabasis]|uniref:FAD-dependent oxidoreductase n=1 Tax=Amycolatopsis anabasis TaxID=1840409 RepID=UPI00131B57B6|nr:NAD(P)/FAD-dependent oxidoreductase [Amycolatopsis anabasis]